MNEGEADWISIRINLSEMKSGKAEIRDRIRRRLGCTRYLKEKVWDYDEYLHKLPELKNKTLFWAFAIFQALLSISMDVKSAFLYGKSPEEVYVKQYSRFRRSCSSELRFTELSRHFYGLHQAPRSWVSDWMFHVLKLLQTRLNVCCLSVCKRFTVHSKTLLFHLEAFSDSDYVETTMKKSTSVRMSLFWRVIVLGNARRTKQFVAIASTEGRICSSCKLMLLRFDITAFEIVMSKGSINDGQVIDFLTGCSINYSLLVDPDLIGPWLQQFWATATLQVINDVPHIRAKVAGKKILISEATIRADRLLTIENGVDCVP
ncbi:putative ribonuclease H-like domain-containing protein [Tanacetum coccineum]